MESNSRNCLFSLELCVDTVDFLGGNTDLSAEEAAKEVVCSLGFIFFEYPPVVLNPPPPSNSTSSWYSKKRLRHIYQVGQSAIFEAEPLELASKLNSQSLTLLAVGPQETETSQNEVLGSGTISLQSFVPPQTENGGRHRFGYLRGSWGCSEIVVPLKDYGGHIIALALVVISISSIDPSLKKFITHESKQSIATNHVVTSDISNTVPSSHHKVVAPLEIPSQKVKFTQSKNAPTSTPSTTGQGSLKMSWDNISPYSDKGKQSSLRSPGGFSGPSSYGDVAVSPNLTPPPSASPSASPAPSSAPSSVDSSIISNLSQSLNRTQFAHSKNDRSEEEVRVLQPLRSSIGIEPATYLSASSSTSTPPASASPVWIDGDSEGLPGLRVSASGAGLKSSMRVSGSGIGLGERSIDLRRTSFQDSFPLSDNEQVHSTDDSTKLNENVEHDAIDRPYFQPVTIDRQESYHFQPRPLFLSNTVSPPKQEAPQEAIPLMQTQAVTQSSDVFGVTQNTVSDSALRMLEEKLSRIEAKLTREKGDQVNTESVNSQGSGEPNQLLKQVMNEMSHLGDHSVLRKLFVEIAKLQADSSFSKQTVPKNVIRQSSEKLRLRTLPVRSRPNQHRYTPPPVQDIDIPTESPSPPGAPPFTPGIGERMDEWFARNQDASNMVCAGEYSKKLAMEMKSLSEPQVLAICERLFGHEDDWSRLNYMRAMSLLSEVVSET